MNEIQYKDIFKNPQTISNLQGKSVTARERLLGNESLMRIMQESKVLIDQLINDESSYIPQLEKLSIRMIKKMFPIIEKYGFEVEVHLGQDQLPPQNEQEEEEEQDVPPQENIDDEAKKRRIINAITQGASIRNALDKPFIELIDAAPDNLLDNYSDTLAGIEDSAAKYGKVLKKVFGVFHDKQALAMFLAMLAGGGGGGAKGGESEAKFTEDGNLKIRAAGLIFPFLIHELIKGVMEIVSLKGFTKDLATNKAAVAAVDKLEYEPEDFAYGTHIEEALENLYKSINVNNKVPYTEFLGKLYSRLEGSSFISFIENLVNDTLTSTQNDIAEECASPEEEVDLSDLGLEENKKPYTDIKVTDKYIIREFNENIDPIELMWHRDNEARTIEIIGKTDWKIQLDNQLPTSLNEQIHIPKHMWHRVIKGNGSLKLKIHKK
jgi:hypothetical protein